MPFSAYGFAAIATFSACVLAVVSVLICVAEWAEEWAARPARRVVQTMVNAVVDWNYPRTPLDDMVFDTWYCIERVEENIAHLQQTIVKWHREQAVNQTELVRRVLDNTTERLYEARFWRRHKYGLMPYKDPHEARNIKAYMAWFAKHVNPILLHPSYPYIGTDAASIIAQYTYEPPHVFSWRVKYTCLLRSLCVWLYERSF